ncbi:MAG: hypothetical protein GY851_05110 [bacterium]|nr:hypothetical protein [bacterium]
MGALGVVLALTAWSLTGSGNAVDIQKAVRDTVTAGPATSLDIHREVTEALGQRAVSESGVVVTGRNVRVRDVDPVLVERELVSGATVDRCFEVNGHGPEPMTVLVPDDTPNAEVEVYRRASRGLYVQPKERPKRVDGFLMFKASHPGAYITRTPDAHSYPTADPAETLKQADSEPEPPETWDFYRVEPDLVDGPIPVILIHGLGAGRWGDIMHWAAHSPDAANFRQSFQLWNYQHPPENVGAPVGFSPEYDGFEESIAATLDRYIRNAEEFGVKTDDTVYHFPEGPFCMVTHSLGALKSRAFMVNFPDQAERVLAVASIAGTHTGSPWATPQWTRHTVNRIGISLPTNLNLVFRGILAELVLRAYLSVQRQGDLDSAWGDFDAMSGYGGLPTATFKAWTLFYGFQTLTISPRDANQTDARYLIGIDDNSFEPKWPLKAYCGGMEHVMPASRGDLYLDRFFLYGGYIDTPRDWFNLVQAETKRTQPSVKDPFMGGLENFALHLVQLMMGQVASAGSDAPLGAYACGDGFVPLQSQLCLDGAESELIYETTSVDGWEYAKLPYRPRMDVIEAHTLANPDRIRLLRGWTHLDTVTGRYNGDTGHSELFSMVSADLLSVLPKQP